MSDLEQVAEVFYGRLADENNESCPVLFVGESPSKSFMEFIQSEHIQYKSFNTKMSMAKALAKFVNWYSKNGNTSIGDFRSLKKVLTDFYKNQRQVIGIDKANVNQDWIEKYMKFSYTELGYFDLFDQNELNVVAQIDRIEAIKKGKTTASKHKFLGHLDSKLIRAKELRAFTEYQDDFPDHIVHKARPEKIANVQGIFPDCMIVPMLFIGCRTKPNQPLPKDISLDNWGEHFHVRDQYLFMYYFFGGLRLSEPLHLFDGDVVVKNEKDRKGVSLPRLHAMLAHPEVAPYQHRGKKYPNRNSFLFETTGEPARTKRHGHYKANWKRLALDDNAGKCTYVYWIGEQEYINLSVVFHGLHRKWRRLIAKEHGDNPFLFLSENGKELSVKAVQGRWARAAKYVGEWLATLSNEQRESLSISNDVEVFTGRREDGQAVHNCRHAYKARAEELGLPVVVIQRALHHKSKDSQDMYGKKSYSDLQLMINKAESKFENNNDESKYVGFNELPVNNGKKSFGSNFESINLDETIKVLMEG